ncbi:Protease HtpX [uncultured archaeon]|nr:Protease HtpX [uncultured archaeon]
MASFYDDIAANKRNSYLLIIAVLISVFAVLYAFTYLWLGDSFSGFAISAVLAIAYISITYSFSSQIVLSLSGAREARKNEFPYLVNVVEGLSLAAGLPTPKIYVIDDAGMNAFATGTSPEHASVAFTTGLLNAMNRAELEGVAAHEISHIKNLDSRMGTLVVVMVGLIALISEFGMRSMFWGRGQSGGGRDRGGGLMMLFALVIIILAPIAAQLVRLALSRQREYLADASGVQLTRYPPGLASALEKIKKGGAYVKAANDTTASLYFANPLSGGQLFSTHPPIEDRIRRLKEMKG